MPRVFIVCVIATLLSSTAARAQPPEANDDDGGANTPEANPAEATAPPEEDGWQRIVFAALLGGGVRSRRIHLDVGDGMGGTEPRDFDTGAYFDFGWHLFIRPMGQRSKRPAIQAMVLQLDGGAGISLVVEPVGTGISLQTNTWRMVGQLGYLYPIGRWQVGGLAGIGGDVFKIDPNFVLPSWRIVYARLGPAGVVDLLGDFLMVRVDFGLRFPFSLGRLENTFGRDTRAFGLDSTLTFQGRIKAGFTYALRFVWEYFRYRFAGETDEVQAMGQGGRGDDHAVNLQLLVGWSL